MMDFVTIFDHLQVMVTLRRVLCELVDNYHYIDGDYEDSVSTGEYLSDGCQSSHCPLYTFSLHFPENPKLCILNTMFGVTTSPSPSLSCIVLTELCRQNLPGRKVWCVQWTNGCSSKMQLSNVRNWELYK